MSRVVVYTKPGCHLCDDACDAVARISAEVGADWSALDITGADALMQQWSEYVPVIVVDGKVHDWFRVREERLRAALS